MDWCYHLAYNNDAGELNLRMVGRPYLADARVVEFIQSRANPCQPSVKCAELGVLVKK